MKKFSIRPITKVKCNGTGNLLKECPNYKSGVNLQDDLGDDADFCNYKGCQGGVDKEREWNYSAIAVYTIVLLVISSGAWILLSPKIPVPCCDPTPTPSFSETPTPTPTPVPKAEKISSIEVPTSVNSLVITDNGETIIAGGEDGNIYLWNAKNGQVESTLSEHTQPVRALVVSPDQLTLASSSEDKTIKIWNLQTQKVIKTIPADFLIKFLAISSDGQTLIGGGLGELIFIWDIQTGGLKQAALKVPEGAGISSLAINGDAGSIVSGNFGATISKWTKNDGGKYDTKTVIGFADGAQTNAVVVSSEGDVIFSSNCTEKIIKKWDANLTEINPPLESDSGEAICSIALSKDGKILVGLSNNKALALWDVQKSQEINIFPVAENEADSTYKGIALSADGKTLAVSASDKIIDVWSLPNQLLER